MSPRSSQNVDGGRAGDRGGTHKARNGTLGRLYSPDGTSVAVKITRDNDRVLLVILDGPIEFTRGTLGRLTLESADGHGVLRTGGSAEHIGPNLLCFVADRQLDVVQRREFVRITTASPVRLERTDGSLLLNTLTINLSGGGMLLKIPRQFEPPREDIYFTLNLGLERHLDQEVTGTGRFTRATQPRRAGFGFTAIAHTDQERLIRFIFDRQRAALAITRGDTV